MRHDPVTYEGMRAARLSAECSALREAKSHLYEAAYQARAESRDEMAERIDAVYALAERLFIDCRRELWTHERRRELETAPGCIRVKT